MVSAIFSEITAVISAFATSLSTSLSAVTGMIYDETNGLTVLGTLVLIGVGVGIVYWAFRLIKGLLHRA